MFCVEPCQLRKLEKLAMESGIPEYTLMSRAGCGAAAEIAAAFPETSRFVILCGKGNNGGDALVVAAELYRRNYPVKIYSLAPADSFTGSAGCAVSELPAVIPFIEKEALDEYDFLSGDVIVDGLLGIGFDGGNLRGAVKSYIAAVNASGCRVVALDIPSGVCGVTGKASADGAVKADLTISFGLPKNGLFCGEGALLRGALRMVAIGLKKFPCQYGMEVFTNLDARALTQRLPGDCHKNSRGRVLVAGGSETYPGAPVLAASAALHSGAGIVRIASNAVLNIKENALIRCDLAKSGWDELFAVSDTLVCGCGWGDRTEESVLEKILTFPRRLILDADALNMIARNGRLWNYRKDCIMTPHPGEAARLMACFGISDTGCRSKNASALAEKLGCVIVYKGRDTVVAVPGGRVVTVAAGSALLATAGSGDVLSGVIGALAADSRISLAEAAMLGVYYHGIAGEKSSKIISADDLTDCVAKVVFSRI